MYISPPREDETNLPILSRVLLKRFVRAWRGFRSNSINHPKGQGGWGGRDVTEMGYSNKGKRQ